MFNRLVLVDRSIDFISAFTTSLTYESLIHEVCRPVVWYLVFVHGMRNRYDGRRFDREARGRASDDFVKQQ